MAEHIRLIDLFAGIGGIRRGFERAASTLDGIEVQSVFASEWDKFAQLTYEANYGDKPYGDITDPDVLAEIPDHDILLAGFPCQPFSLAGVSKKTSLGRPHGFLDPTQGTLFHEIVKILDQHRPAAFMLENVKHLERHDRGRTFAVITEALDGLGYSWTHAVINASLRVPQNRERIYIVGYREDLGFMAGLPDIHPEPAIMREVLHEYADGGEIPIENWDRAPDEGLARYELSNHLWQYLQDYAAKHRAAGNGFGFGLVDVDGISRTLSARYHKDGSEILVPQDGGRNPRRLTPRECSRLQGFDLPGRNDFRIVCSDTQAYRQFGNAVAVPIIEELAREMLPKVADALDEQPKRSAA